MPLSGLAFEVGFILFPIFKAKCPFERRRLTIRCIEIIHLSFPIGNEKSSLNLGFCG